MANTFVDYTGDNTTTSFAFSFPYLDDSHIVVQVDQASVSGGAFVTKTLTTDYTIQTSPSKAIIFVTAPATGDRIRIKRDSASETALVDFENGSVLTEVELDRAYLHNLYLNEEIEEGSGKNVMTKNSAGNFEADLAKIVDLADPTAAQDAATKNYVDTEITTERTARIADVDAEETARIAADALKVAKSGDTMSGNLSMGSNKVTSSATPSSGTDLTNKTYVDAGDADQVNKTGDSMSGALAMGSNKITGLGTPTSSDDATNKSYVDAQIATTLATGVAGGPIDTANIADDAVTADKLDHTAVTPADYTNANITVDQQGRITAASNGSSGAPTANEILTSLKTVDGTGSGLDADLLDGLEATAFATTVSLGNAATDIATNATDIATNASDIATNATAIASNTTAITNITDGTTAVPIADGAVTSAKISSTDTTFNVDTNVGIGAVAGATFKLDVTGTGNNAQFSSDNPSGTSAIFVRNNSTTGNSAIIQLVGQSGGGTSFSNSINIDLSSVNNYLQMVFNQGDEVGVRLQNSNGGSGSESGAWYPTFDNKTDLGLATNRWDTVFAGTGAINTSDRNEKEEIEELSEAEKRVAQACKGLVRKFKFKGKVRKHIGVIAQDVRDAFSAEGLDATQYGLFCSDTFEDENGVVVTRLGIRYDELLAFIISAL